MRVPHPFAASSRKGGKRHPHFWTGSLPVILGLAFLLAAPTLVTAQVSLATAVDLAQRNSTAVRLAQTDVDKAVSSLRQVTDAYIPSLTIGSQVGYSHGFPTGQPSVASASMQSLVFSPAQRQYTRAAHAGVEAANLALKDAREQVALDVSSAYIEMDTVNTELAAARQQEDFSTSLVRIEIERSEAGVDSSLDLLQARLTEAQLRLKRLHLEARTATLAKQISVLTGMPIGSITPDHASIPDIPAITAETPARSTPGLDSASALAQSKQFKARGDQLTTSRIQIGFGAIYNYDSNELNSYSTYYNNFTPNNVSFGLQFQIPLFDLARHALAKQSAADALRAKVEAEQARDQNDVQIASLTGDLHELDAQAEVASLKQQISAEQLKAVLAQLELGNGASSGPGAQPQLSPKSEQFARIDERQKFQDALDASFDLAKARLGLLRALGHMQDWLNELHAK
jgi:outer membrane protein TolC